MTTTPTTVLPANCILIYTDGSCSGNPGPGGFAAVLRRIENNRETSKIIVTGGTSEFTTNVRMEMRAVIASLHGVPADDELPIIVRTDNQMIVKGITEWHPGWAARGWRKSDGKPVQNRDLWEEILEFARWRDLTFQWVKGHASDPMNAEVDDLAVAARNKYKAAVLA